jgi:superfamily II DNA or RNA helicase
MIKLRDYQIEARDAIIANWRGGEKNTLLQMTMGCGKTETFLGVLAEERKTTPGFRALIVAHREELITQPRDRVAAGWTDRLPVPGIVQGKNNDANAEIVIATIQTLQRRKRKGDRHGRFWRLRDLLAYGRFTHLIIDECHHAPAPTYRELIRALRWLNPELRHLGVTATPRRLDEVGLKSVYGTVAYRIGIKDAIEKLGVLTPFVGYGYTLPADMKKVKLVAGDYSGGDLDRLMHAQNIADIIVEKWRQDGDGRQTIAFMPGVESARMLADTFNAVGVAAGFAHGGTPKNERRQTISDFRTGKTNVLVNCMLWTEGFDVPSIQNVIVCRPTKSDSLYLQMVGRGLRLHPGKTDCLIMDFAPRGDRDIIMAGDLLGVPRKTKRVEQQAKDDDIVLDVFGMLARRTGIDADPDHVQLQVIDFFAKRTPLKFTYDGRTATASVNMSQTIAIVFPQEERVAIADELRASGKWSPIFDDAYAEISSYQVALIENRRVTLLELCESYDAALDAANDFGSANMDATLAKKSQAWRSGPASAKQRGLCVRLGVWQSGMTKGQAAQAITHKFALDALVAARMIK